ncbi:MAG: leucine-rich repeat domain-containing protein, partial [Sphingomonadales bacterium]
MMKNYDQNTAISALLRGETIPVEWMDELAKVKTLSLSDNQIVDPSGLAALTGLKWLYLRGNQIVDPSG